MKKFLSMILAAMMVVGMLAGCTPAANENSQNPEQPSTPVQGTDPSTTPDEGSPEPAGKPLEGQTIKLAALSSGYITNYPDMWDEICTAFEEETGATVQLTLEKNLEEVIGPSMQGGDYPDVILCATGRGPALTEQFIKDKLIADISDVFDMTVPGESVTVSSKVMSSMLGTNATAPYGDGKIYLAPMFYAPCGLFYNAGLLQEKGWSVPTTWDEMWELGEKAKEEDIALFTYPTTGYFDAFLYALMYSVGGSEFFNNATSYAEGVWDTPEAQQCFDIIEKLASYTAEVTPAQANETDFSQNQQLILDNKAIFCPNGTWLPGEMADAPRADGFQWGMTALPAATSGGKGASYAFLEQIWIPSGAENIDAAKQFIAFMYSDKAADIFLKGGAVQPINGITSKLEGDNLMFYSVYDNGATPVVGVFSSYASVAGLGSVREVFLDPVNGLVSGQITKDQWIADIKAASDQMRANLV